MISLVHSASAQLELYLVGQAVVLAGRRSAGAQVQGAVLVRVLHVGDIRSALHEKNGHVRLPIDNSLTTLLPKPF